MSAQRRRKPIVAKNGAVVFIYRPSYESGEVNISKAVYFKDAPYAAVAGEKWPGAVAFHEEWAMYSLREDGSWRLDGRNDTANLERCFSDASTRWWFGTWAAAHKALCAYLAKAVVATKEKHERLIRLRDRALKMKEPRL